MTGATSNITPPKIINNVAGHREQLEMWTAHYRKTLNCYSNSYNPETKQLKSTNIAPEEFDLHSVLQITLKLDPKKAYKRHLLWKYAPTSAIMNLKKALTLFWVEGKDLGSDIWRVDLQPIPKSQDKDLSDLKSWRPISIGTTEAFILEKLIANQLEAKFATENNQFAYKKDHGCGIPVKLLKTLNSNCILFWALFLYASAALDRILHARIKQALINADFIDTEIDRILFMLKSDIYNVNWLNLVGEPFTQNNGIKQGGGLSDKIY